MKYFCMNNIFLNLTKKHERTLEDDSIGMKLKKIEQKY